MIKVLICDDDKAIRDDIENILKESGYVDYIKKVKNGIEAIEFIKSEKIDLLIIDIDMPYKNGIETAKEITSIDKDIHIIFVTGFSDYSLESFKVHPVDFIVKPFTRDKIIDSVNIAIDHINSHKLAKTNFIDDTLFVYKIRKQIHMLNFDDIVMFEKNSRAINLYTKDHDIIKFYENFDDLEKRIPPNFFKSHKSYIVNLKLIHKVIPTNRSSLEIRFINFQESATLSKTLEKDFLYRFYRTKRF
ncbi:MULTISPECIES: LytR/AlgR family response regulator transcription factor [Romboutsia]|uniref:Stage 0 sporulation protein A homolog n=2 Tax=Romboutsia TaxID=1501226 RepID=A0A2P2BQN5_9FIRM|nr:MULTISPECIES: LytTR family DNA-binding domain-containing protein [Romboutsia]MCH1960004.1 LytTR family DNA-binding domain-containing protein [Romboutsia hominis]MCH1969568.1 LytTR family DNA-binding domain-containing protein [Romboutsia hominis]MDB8794541.1 LytTR family DNA-binding domain-containing protein [Romboutsia sp. 1001216sp1]MDB8796111.1 LytTR family DNA-binding domain-containing protein [Romboutsia sp. 1001216sp1]MDB8798104.1 LytTR family DNA-binding domain-containing protein [Rom